MIRRHMGVRNRFAARRNDANCGAKKVRRNFAVRGVGSDFAAQDGEKQFCGARALEAILRCKGVRNNFAAEARAARNNFTVGGRREGEKQLCGECAVYQDLTTGWP